MTNTVQPRDANGWRIPRKGTLSYRVYLLFTSGIDASVIAGKTGKSLNTIRVLINRFQHPDTHNKSALKGYYRKRS